jgi:hypothetical protein
LARSYLPSAFLAHSILLLLAPRCTSFVRGLNGLRCLNGLRGLRGLRGLHGLLGSHHSLCQNKTPPAALRAEEGTPKRLSRAQHADTHLPACPSATASFLPPRALSRKSCLFRGAFQFSDCVSRPYSHKITTKSLSAKFVPIFETFTITFRPEYPKYNSNPAKCTPSL